MQFYRKLILAVALTFWAITALAAKGVTPAMEQQFAKLPLPTQLWIKLEAKREAATNTISRETALKAIDHAGRALNLASMPADDIVALVMMNIVKDAENDMREILDSVGQFNGKKNYLRDEAGKQKSQGSAAVTPVKLSRSPVLDAALLAKKLDFNALQSLSNEQQVKLQLATDRYTKAEAILLNTPKK